MKKEMAWLVPMIGVGIRYACLAFNVSHSLNYPSRILMHASLIGGAVLSAKNFKNKFKSVLVFWGVWLGWILAVVLLQFMLGVGLLTT